jgi:hypothetical protein
VGSHGNLKVSLEEETKGEKHHPEREREEETGGEGEDKRTSSN